MTHTTFHPLNFQNDIIQAFERQGAGDIVAKDLEAPPKNAPTELAGHGVWGSPNDYIKLLSALLDDGGPILSKESVDEIFTPQMLHPKALNEMVKGPYKPVLGPSIPPNTKIDHGLGGVINLEAIPGRRAKDTLQWSGAPNLIWVIFPYSFAYALVLWLSTLLLTFASVGRPKNWARRNRIFTAYAPRRSCSRSIQYQFRRAGLQCVRLSSMNFRNKSQSLHYEIKVYWPYTVMHTIYYLHTLIEYRVGASPCWLIRHDCLTK